MPSPRAPDFKLLLGLSVIAISVSGAQVRDTVRDAVRDTVRDTVRARVDLPPATKLEAFRPKEGMVTTIAYEEVGTISRSMSGQPGVRVTVMQAKDTDGGAARGILFEIFFESRIDTSFVDEDELPELVKGLDALISVRDTATVFKYFQVHYSTRGNLVVSVMKPMTGGFQRVVTVGRARPIQREINKGELERLRLWVEAARRKLDSVKS